MEEEESEEEDEGEKENKRVSVEIKKVFTRIITKAEEVQKNVASRIERKREKDIQLEHSRYAPTSFHFFYFFYFLFLYLFYFFYLFYLFVLLSL